VEEVFGIKVVVEKESLALFHTRLRGKVRICCLIKLRYEVYRNMTMVQWDNGSHGGTIGTGGFLQHIHTSDGVRDMPVTTRHGELRDDIETVDICEVEGKFGFCFPNRVKDALYLPYEKSCPQR
jgi:hypothetical protein